MRLGHGGRQQRAREPPLIPDRQRSRHRTVFCPAKDCHGLTAFFPFRGRQQKPSALAVPKGPELLSRAASYSRVLAPEARRTRRKRTTLDRKSDPSWSTSITTCSAARRAGWREARTDSCFAPRPVQSRRCHPLGQRRKQVPHFVAPRLNPIGKCCPR
jgi:hypothetical protein